MSKNLSELSGKKGLKYNLFNKMGELAIEEGTPSIEELDKLADEFLIGKANTYGTATFYDFLKPENKGKKVYWALRRRFAATPKIRGEEAVIVG